VKERQQIGNVDARTNIEVWLVKAAEKLKKITTGPVC